MEKIDKPETVNDSVAQIIKYDKGVIIDSFGEVRGKIEGLRFSFDKKSKTRIYSNYNDDRLNGIEKGYFMNGVLSYITNFRNDTVVGETFYYYPSGQIKTYEFNTFTFGQLIYQRKYDLNGKTIKSIGRGLIHFNQEKDSIKIGNEFYGVFILAMPPKTKTYLMIADFTQDTIGVNHRIYEGGQERIYKEKFYKAGNIKKIIFWSIEDSLTKQVHKGHKVLDIYVKAK
ncbi:MAG: hypothetical protein H0W73_04895 [Bacteroidetes bacterium]|nr:hypothetical protein [Bacteroidota bacterium]